MYVLSNFLFVRHLNESNADTQRKCLGRSRNPPLAKTNENVSVGSTIVPLFSTIRVWLGISFVSLGPYVPVLVTRVLDITF